MFPACLPSAVWPVAWPVVSSSSFQRDYAPLLTCTAAAWSAANLPLLAVAWFLPRFFVAASGLAYLYFVVLMFFAVRTVFGTGNGAAIAIVCFIVDSAGGGMVCLESAAISAGLARLAFFPRFTSFTFCAANSATWEPDCATGRASGAIWRPPRSILTMAKRSISLA